jgi:hypothetical protein
MKTRLTLLFLAFAFICNAQSWLKLKTFNLEDVRQISDNIALNARDPFKLESQGIPEDNRIYYVVTYINKSDVSDSIVVMFRINYVGGTDDRINPGTPQYSFTKATGTFDSLFPFWIKFMKPTSIEETVKEKTKDEAIVKGATFDFNVELNRWTILKF